jgi:hypothetical protein
VTWRTRGLQRVVNVEQAPKRIMRKPTLTLSRGRLAWPVKRAVKATGHSAGVMTAARVYREIDATREVPSGERVDAQPVAREGQAGPLGMADGLV